MKSVLCVCAAVALAAAGAETPAAEKKVGIIGLDTSHAIAFTKLMNVEKDPDCAGLRVVAAYQWGSKDIIAATNRYPQYLAQIKEMGVEIVPSIAALLERVDCVLLETNDGREHLPQAREVFRSGKPVFIDKPLAHSLGDAIKIVEEGRAANAKWFSSSALRYSNVAKAARAGEYGRVRGAALISPAPVEPQGTHNFYTWYGIHGFEPLVAIMGMGVEKVACFRNDTDDVIIATWKDGRMGELRLMRKSWIYSGYVLPEKKLKGHTSPVVVYDGYQGYQPLLKEIVKFFRTGVVPVPNEETLEIMAFMEAAEMSAKRGGAPVTIAEAMAAARAK